MSERPQSVGVLILAAGKGIRMRSDKPKVLQPLLEEPVIYYLLKAASEAGMRNTAVLAGYRGELVEEYVKRDWPETEVIWQKEQLGTGHAVKSAQAWWKRYDNLLVLSGDVPLVRHETLLSLWDEHIASSSACALMSFVADDPAGYGRLARLADGGVRIVEQSDATEEELLIQEINAGVYLFNTAALSGVIDKLTDDNELGEYYLTDTVQLIDDTEGDIRVVSCGDPGELVGVNTPNDLAMASGVLRKRILNFHMENGLKCMDPSTTWIGPRARVAPDVIFEPGVQLWGNSVIGNGCRIGAWSTLRDVSMGEGARVYGPSVISDSAIGANAEAGPFAFLRMGVKMEPGSRVGRFVEVKNSTLGEGVNAMHLSYLGDASVGRNTNIGAGTVTCNYDGTRKNATVIGDGCFVGSDTMFVAPVKMGNNAATAAGSVITKDIPDGSLGMARERQINIDGWNERKGIVSGGVEKAGDCQAWNQLQKI
ncbi:MAG: bifunctional UDP-N-acetylglucosamine diphosphorylase/glucosamine-1-phosphate N-acetyltransferase GlmU [Synergistaceae bacterium]|jgi:bifunctional UDP-N-acetylglucosamine pyrophosphorylase/glucosamine-1-phosphate N-acetyltransferase|nr:bifunctional UDP-N-acetylglucosamine diphosphorylase/glucosamine-1-phosphate N-acetyltransferase GlmU [Synergistaceae bacterium]